MQHSELVVRGAREHNLKNINVTIPRDKLIVITGLSGSGKSSLAFDTIYAEGQRRYVESLSAYARQFLGMMEKPDVDFIEGLSPAISIEQKTTHRNPRSTVGTVTEIYDYLRLLFARIGKPHCYNCGRPVTRQTVQDITDNVLQMPDKTKIQVMAPVVRGRKGAFADLFSEIKKDGFVRARVDGEVYDLADVPNLDKKLKHNIDVIIDRLVIKTGIGQRLTDSIETALALAEGKVVIDDLSAGIESLYSEKLACLHCHLSFEELTPRMFSFNTPFGACKECDGLGFKSKISEKLIIKDENKSVNSGAIPYITAEKNTIYYDMIKNLTAAYPFDLSTPWKNLPKKVRETILYGSGDKKIKFRLDRGDHVWEYTAKYEGIIPNLERRYKQTTSQHVRSWIEGFMVNDPCPVCDGHRLRQESLNVFIKDVNIAAVTGYSIDQAVHFFDNLTLTEKENFIVHQVMKEINARLGFLKSVGLGYLNLSRSAGTLSGGEAQRIRLATQIGSQLMGVMYVLDEPSIGLHQRDNEKLINTLEHLRDLGNTVIVVEHDRDTIERSDFVIDLGPGAGRHGGDIVAQGPPSAIAANDKSITGLYLSRKREVPARSEARKSNGKAVSLKGATGNNLKNVAVKIPLGNFIAVTGVSGSGKSSLINETLYKALAQKLSSSKALPLPYKKLEGLQHIDKVIDIDQSPIGRTPRSNPATYTGLFGPLRELFSQLPESKVRGYKPGRFSFNVKGGRCEACEGDGLVKIEMHFLPDVYVTCEVCKGRRYNRETLEIKYKGKSIADILEMTVDEALDFLQNIPAIKRRLEVLARVGLGYIHLGQQATTLSGGEAQRVKLATELAKIQTGSTLYILDEPTTGLHFEDVRLLLDVLDELVDKGNTVIVIEHNLDVIKRADHIIDIGPEGGDNGGEIIVAGTPEDVMACAKSHTGRFLKIENESKKDLAEV
jgi:excinuclease ABC subunit A